MPDRPSAAGIAARAAEDPPVVLATHGLTKTFDGLVAVDHLDLSVRQGDVFGFLGPNGAGKTTTIRMIFGLLYPTSGHVEVLDHRDPQDKREALRHIGGIGQVPDTVGYLERADSKVGDYSHGMKQRLGIANALLHRPELIILDEPTSGLDPQGMKDVRELIRALGTGGTTVFLSSHLLHEIEQVCNRAMIINKGRVVIEGPVADLRPASSAVKVLTSDQERARGVIAALVGPQAVASDEGYLVVEGSDGTVREIVRRLVGEGLGVDAVIPAREQGLEDYFLGLTQSSDVDARPETARVKGAVQ